MNWRIRPRYKDASSARHFGGGKTNSRRTTEFTGRPSAVVAGRYRSVVSCFLAAAVKSSWLDSRALKLDRSIWPAVSTTNVAITRPVTFADRNVDGYSGRLIAVGTAWYRTSSFTVCESGAHPAPTCRSVASVAS